MARAGVSKLPTDLHLSSDNHISGRTQPVAPPLGGHPCLRSPLSFSTGVFLSFDLFPVGLPPPPGSASGLYAFLDLSPFFFRRRALPELVVSVDTKSAP